MASKAAADVDTDDGSLTPSEPSDGERSEHDSDYETEHEEETEGEQAPNVVWTGYGKKTPVILFKGEAVIKKRNDYKAVGERYHMAFKMGSSDCRIVRTILNTHGFREVHPNSSDYNIMWTGSHLKPFTLRSLTEFQKVNHFPRSYEITRKDRLFKNVQRMQQIKGTKHFDFVAQSFIMPTEYQEFCSCFVKEKGTWIVKPVASSRGRGVFLVNHPDQVPLDENVIVSKYISNPVLIDGFKFDVRLYVAVTSYDPIVIYLYEEGLTRFATVKYEKANKHLRNQCMHLTNYSVNKKNKDYVQNDDPDIEDYGNKWSLGALLRYLKSQKKDVTALMMRIEDVIIKTIMSAEMPIATACKMFMPFRGNCFELYGFDILIDDHLKPWVLEVNLSPSLACDAPLDLKIKANMISDLLSLSGLMCQDPVLRSLQQSRRNQELSGRIGGRIKSAHIRALSSIRVKARPQSAGGKLTGEKQQSGSMAGLTGEEIKIVRRVKEEEERKGGWVRIFPSADSWDLYGPLLQFNTTHNAMLHQRLYPERHKGFVSSLSHKSSATSIGHRNKLLYSQLSTSPLCKLDFTGDAYGHALLRTRQYLRKLNGGNDGRKKQRRRRAKTSMERKTSRRSLAQGLPEEDEEEEGEELDGAGLEPPMTSETSTQKQTQAVKCSTEDKGPAAQQKTTAKQDMGDQTTKPQSQEQVVSLPKLDVMEMLVKGEGALNKVQARTAFAMYLIRVQQRLLSECNSHSAEDVEAMNEQMELVLRFLKRAAVNLHQTFKVIVPSRKLPLNERRRILAKQLSDFVYVYTKETEQLRNKPLGDKKSLRSSTGKEGISEEKFERFISIASETELEEVLTTYTKLNKSASIFLGTKSPNKGGVAGETSKPDSGHGLAKRKDTPTESDHVVSLEAPPSRATPPQALAPPSSPAPAFIGWEEAPDTKAVLDSLARNEQRSLRSKDTGNMLLPTKTSSPLATCNSPAASTFAKAVAVYSAKLTRSRPSSASNNKSGVRVINHRPASANSERPLSAGKPPLERGYVEVYNEKAINEALQRLAHRQQARQYSATNSTVGFVELPSNVPLYRSNSQQSIRAEVFRTRSLSTGDSSTADMHKVQRQASDKGYVCQPDASQGKYISVEEHRSSSRPPSRPQVRPASSADQPVCQKNMSASLKTANATFNNFIEDKGPSWQSDLALAYNQITGNNLNQFRVGSQGNRSYKVAQQQQLVKQQRMMAQSKALLESSKAKHLAMVAQAHAAQLPGTQSQLGSQASLNCEAGTQAYEPKPPARPVTGKKVNNHFRVARPVTLEMGAGGDKHINPDTFQLRSQLVSSSISGAKLLSQ